MANLTDYLSIARYPTATNGIVGKYDPKHIDDRTLANANVYDVQQSQAYGTLFAIDDNNGWMYGGMANLFFSRVYFIPSPIDLGNLVSTTIKQILVWNATDDIKTLNQVQYTAGQGIEVVSDNPLPRAMPEYSITTLTMTAYMEGVPSIDLDINITFADTDSFSMKVTGKRLVLFPYSPEADFTERFEWVTTISTAYADEIRTKMRQTPRTELSYECVVDYHHIGALIDQTQTWGFRKWGVPLWHFGMLIASAAQGANIINVVIGDLPYKVGDLIIVWIDANTYHVTELTDIQPTFIQIDEVLPFNVTNAYLAPVAYARAPSGIKIRKTSNDNWVIAKADFKFDSFNLPSWGALPITYKGDYLYTKPITVANNAVEFSKASFNVFDNGTASPVYMQSQKNTPWQWMLSDILIDKDEYLEMLKFLDYTSGRYKAFWIPDWASNYTLAQDVNDLDTEIRIQPNVTLETEKTGDVYLWINGQLLPFEITDTLMDDPAGELILFLASPWAQGTISKDATYLFGKLRRIRFDADKITIKHDGKFASRVAIKIKEPTGN